MLGKSLPAFPSLKEGTGDARNAAADTAQKIMPKKCPAFAGHDTLMMTRCI
jgi:hypothetical protein